MPFECPACAAGGLKITFSLELPPGSDDDEVTLQTVKCDGCEFRGIAVYRESRRGALDSESWHHDGYQVADESLESVMAAMLACPSPGDRRCRCATHSSLGKLDWSNPSHNGMQVTRSFKMKWVR